MIRRLRRKFILVCMASVFVVMLLVVMLINALYAARSNETLDGMLAFLTENGGSFPTADSVPEGDRPQRARSESEWNGELLDSPEAPFVTRHFSVLLDANGEAVETNTDSVAAVSEEDAVLYAQSVLGGSTTGYCGIYRYMLSQTDAGETLAVFLDAGMQIRNGRHVLLISCTVALLISSAIFLLVCFFSKRAVRSIAVSIEKQRQFITDAGHELKTPLTIISANCEILELNQGENEWLDGIENQVSRLRKLVNNLVTLSRLDEERPAGLKVRFSLSDAVYDTAMTFSATAERSGKRLRVTVEPDVFIAGDEGAVRQIASILLDNAVKYADQGGEIAVSLIGGRRPVLSVENDYSAVNELALSRLFDRFYRADPARTGDGSHGLGLSIARSIAETHRASIRAEKAGEGRLRLRVRF